MKIKILLRNQDELIHSVDGEPYAVGGEGRIYPIYHQRYGDCFLKLYSKPEKAATHEQKIRYMMSQRPPFVNENIRYCWPVGIAQDIDTGRFLGFMMPAAFSDSSCMSILSDYTIGSTISQEYPSLEQWHQKYELQENRGLCNRMRVLKNWAIAIKGLHDAGLYCIGDIKPDNVLISPRGYVSIIDMDSIQVYAQGELYRATAYTPNYFPSEAYDLWKAKKPLNRHVDSFAYGCCAYTVLTGTHPYTNVRLLSPYDSGEYNLISTRIKNGLYLRGDKSSYIRTVAVEYNLHANFDRLPPELRKLFDQAFTQSIRPTMEEWIRGLNVGIKKFDE